MKCTTPYHNRVPAHLGWVADIDRLFGELRADAKPNGNPRGFVPAMDISETNQGYEVLLELPGVAPENVQIEVKDEALLVQGEKKPTPQEGLKHHRLERAFGQFQRSLKFPQAVDFDRTEATFEDGLLRLSIPKTEKALPRKIEIKRPAQSSQKETGSN